MIERTDFLRSIPPHVGQIDFRFERELLPGSAFSARELRVQYAAGSSLHVSVYRAAVSAIQRARRQGYDRSQRRIPEI
jgi:hypothetical protein